MKTLSPKTVITLIIITFFSLSIFAKGLEFKVRVFEADKTKVIQSFKDSLAVTCLDGKIDVGSFNDYFLAMKLQYFIEEKGFNFTEIVSFFNDEEIPIDDAFALLNNLNDLDQNNMSYDMSEAEMDLALKMVQREEFYYSIQIGVFSEEAVNKFFDFPKQIDESITSKGYYRYTYGKFGTLQDAKDALVMLQNNYFEKAFIIAFDNLERIPLTAALEKEKRLLEESIAAVNP